MGKDSEEGKRDPHTPCMLLHSVPQTLEHGREKVRPHPVPRSGLVDTGDRDEQVANGSGQVGWALHTQSLPTAASVQTTVEGRAWVAEVLRNLGTSLGTVDRGACSGRVPKRLRAGADTCGTDQAAGALTGEQTVVLG